MIWTVIIVYLISALSFGFYEVAQDPYWTMSAATVGRMAGSGLAVFALSGLFPVIGWAFVKFRSSRAVVPLLTWLVIEVGMAYSSDFDSRFDRRSKIDKFLSDGGLVGKEKDDFLRTMKYGCEQKQRSHPLTSRIGLSDDKIIAYCDCVATGAFEALTIEELRHLALNGKPPKSFTDKANQLGQLCTSEIFKKKS